MAAVCVIAKNWKQSECPSADEWISKLAYPDNEVLLSNKKWWNIIHTEKHSLVSKLLCWVKECRQKDYNLYKIQEYSDFNGCLRTMGAGVVLYLTL